jgi:hypothetical protein
MISSQALRAFNNALLDLYAPGLDLDNYAERGFRFLTRLVSVELSVYGLRDVNRDRGNVTFRMDRPLPGIEEVVEPFGRLAPKYDWFCGTPELNAGKPCYRSDFYSDRQYRNLDIHTEVFRRWDHENFMTMCVASVESLSFFFGFSREKGDFSRKERALLELAQPHLIAARRLAASLSAVKPWSLSPEMFSAGGFTLRESEVLYWLTEGKSNRDRYDSSHQPRNGKRLPDVHLQQNGRRQSAGGHASRGGLGPEIPRAAKLPFGRPSSL